MSTSSGSSNLPRDRLPRDQDETLDLDLLFQEGEIDFDPHATLIPSRLHPIGKSSNKDVKLENQPPHIHDDSTIREVFSIVRNQVPESFHKILDDHMKKLETSFIFDAKTLRRFLEDPHWCQCSSLPEGLVFLLKEHFDDSARIPEAPVKQEKKKGRPTKTCNKIMEELKSRVESLISNPSLVSYHHGQNPFSFTMNGDVLKMHCAICDTSISFPNHDYRPLESHILGEKEARSRGKKSMHMQKFDTRLIETIPISDSPDQAPIHPKNQKGKEIQDKKQPELKRRKHDDHFDEVSALLSGPNSKFEKETTTLVSFPIR